MYELLGATSAPHCFEVSLHPADPLLGVLADFKRAANYDKHPPPLAHQRRLVSDLQQGEESAANALIDSHRGVIAAVAYSFMTPDVDSTDLLVTGARGLVETAQTFDLQDPDRDFNDQAVAAVQEAMRADYPETRPFPAGSSSDRPMERVHHLISGLRVTSTVDLKPKRNKQYRRDMERLASLTSSERLVLPLLHLTDREISEQSGANFESVPAFTSAIVHKLRVNTRTAAALKALKLGVEFEIKSPPADARFTRRERQVADHLDLRNPQIQAELNLTKNVVSSTVSSLLQKTGAKTRTELALMRKLYHFRPAPGEAEIVPEALADFTPQQRKVLQLLHLPYEEIAERSNLDDDQVNQAITYAKHRMERPMSTTDLALELQRRGLEFDIKKPDRALVEILTNTEVKIAGLLGLPNEEIAKILEVKRINDRIWYMKQKLGARTRIEMALMVAKFDTGERRDERELTPREQLAAKLGLTALDGYDIEGLLKEFTSLRENEALTTYYLRDEPISWRKASQQIGVSYSTAVKAAERGVLKIRRGLVKLAPSEALSDETSLEADEEYLLEQQAA